MAFKIGDRVRVVADETKGRNLVGQEGVVVVSEDGYDVYDVRIGDGVYDFYDRELVTAATKVYEGVVKRHHAYAHDWYSISGTVVSDEELVGEHVGKRVRLTIEVLD